MGIQAYQLQGIGLCSVTCYNNEVNSTFSTSFVNAMKRSLSLITQIKIADLWVDEVFLANGNVFW